MWPPDASLELLSVRYRADWHSCRMDHPCWWVIIMVSGCGTLPCSDSLIRLSPLLLSPQRSHPMGGPLLSVLTPCLLGSRLSICRRVESRSELWTTGQWPWHSL